MAGNDNLIALSPHPLVVDETPVMYRAGQIRSLFSALADRDAQIERMRSELDRLATPAPPPEPAKAEVVVKPLEWSWEPPYSVARALGGHYAVEQWEGARGSFHFDLIGTFLTKHDGFASHDEAKAAAQADYERRILSALATPPTAPAAARSAAEAKMHAVNLEQCSIFVDSNPIKRAMTDAAAFIRASIPGEEA
ncbi:hypothetical protein V5F34_00785 [Xanthobacter autotrophicus]|uniref:hypothetical protein n=1 Tax=Xanthobacter autotrophicus TaxID=280 RepID=UPI00372816DD